MSSGVISSLLVGTANGCSCVNYQAPNKKQIPIQASEVTKIRKLQVLSVTTPIVNQKKQYPYSSSDFVVIKTANRLLVPASKFLGQNFQ